MDRTSEKWTDEEVQALLACYAAAEVERNFEGPQRNIKIFARISAELADGGIVHTPKQCREKIKKLKQDYKKIKDHNNQSGAIPKTSKWFDTLDEILGHRPAYSGNAATKECLEAAVCRESVSTTEELEEMVAEANSFAAPAATSHSSRHGPELASASSSTGATSSSAGTPYAPRPRKRKRADTLQATLQEMLESDAEQRRQSDARLDRMLQFFREQAEMEAEERMALRAEMAEARQQHISLMEGLLGVVNLMAARQQQQQQPPE